MNHYDKLIELCSKAKIQVLNKKTHKTKDYQQLLESCDKRKCEIVKKLCDNIHPYGTKTGYSKNCTDHIELISNTAIKKLKTIDRIIFLIEKELNNQDKNSDICNLMNITTNKSASCSDVDINSAYIAEYSNTTTTNSELNS